MWILVSILLKLKPNWADNSVTSLFHGEMWLILVFSTKLPNRSEKFSVLLLDFVVVTFFTPLHHYCEFIFQPNFFKLSWPVETCIPLKILICIIVFESKSRSNKGNLKQQTEQFSNTFVFNYSKCSRPLPQF